jgi:hypothetical protein
MAWLRMFARLIETTAATDDEVRVCEWYCAYPFSKEHQPERREQRVLETRRWHDPSKVTCDTREGGRRPAKS